MHRTLARVLVVAGSLAVSASTALAQGTTNESSRPFKFGAALGASLPMGDFGDVAETGFHVGALGEFARTSWPVLLRGEITYHRNGFKDYDGNASVLSFVPNIVFPFGTATSTARPYLIGGLGLHRVSLNLEVPGSEDESESETKFGFNVGAGFNFNLAGFETFIETRWHSVSTSESKTNFVPLSFGFKF